MHSVPAEAAEGMRDLVRILEDAIVKRTGLSNLQRLHMLFTNVKIGHRKLSRMFRYKKQLLGS